MFYFLVQYSVFKFGEFLKLLGKFLIDFISAFNPSNILHLIRSMASRQTAKPSTSKTKLSKQVNPDLELTETVEEEEQTESERLLKVINSIGTLNFETIKIDEVPINKPIEIERLFFTYTVFGKRLVAELGCCEGTSQYQGKHLFLPERFKHLTEDELQKITEAKYKLISKGLKKLDNGRFARIIEFSQ